VAPPRTFDAAANAAAFVALLPGRVLEAALIQRHAELDGLEGARAAPLLEQLESGRDTSLDLQSQISQHLNALAREVQALEALLSTIPVAQRSLWRKRVSQLQDESASQRAALGKFAGQVAAKQRHEEERQALLHRRTNGADCAINIDAIAQESRKLNESHSQIDDLLGYAASVLSETNRQGSSLKGIQKKVLSIGSTLGLSNNTLRMIERRLFGDKLILYGGMALTMGLLWFVFVHLRREAPQHDR
jgi:Golgi SNAP receptor complex protein 2